MNIKTKISGLILMLGLVGTSIGSGRKLCDDFDLSKKVYTIKTQTTYRVLPARDTPAPVIINAAPNNPNLNPIKLEQKPIPAAKKYDPFDPTQIDYFGIKKYSKTDSSKYSEKHK
jgi:hypothetical protein